MTTSFIVVINIHFLIVESLIKPIDRCWTWPEFWIGAVVEFLIIIALWWYPVWLMGL